MALDHWIRDVWTSDRSAVAFWSTISWAVLYNRQIDFWGWRTWPLHWPRPSLRVNNLIYTDRHHHMDASIRPWCWSLVLQTQTGPQKELWIKQQIRILVIRTCTSAKDRSAAKSTHMEQVLQPAAEGDNILAIEYHECASILAAGRLYIRPVSDMCFGNGAVKACY